MRNKKPIDELTVEQLERRLTRLQATKEKVEVLLKIGFRIRTTNLDRAVVLTNQAIMISETLRFIDGLSSGYRLLAIINYQMVGDLVQALDFAQKSVELAGKTDNDNLKLEARSALAEVLYSKGDIHRSLEMMQENLVQAQELSNELIKLSSLSNIATILSRTGKMKESIPYFNEAIEYCQKINDESKLAVIHNNLASAYSYMDDIGLAIRHSFISKEIRERLGEKSNLASTLLNLAHHHTTISDYDTALTIIKQADVILEGTGNKRLIAGVKLFLGEIYAHLNRPDDATEQYSVALNVYNQLGQLQRAAIVGQALGQTLVQSGKIVEGLQLLEHYVVVAKEHKDDLWIGEALLSYGQGVLHSGDAVKAIEMLEASELAIGDACDSKLTISLAKAHMSIDSYKVAKKYIDKSFELLRVKPILSDEVETLKILSEINAKEGDYEAAYNTSNTIMKKISELHDTNTAHKINTLLIQFDVEKNKRESEVNKLKAEKLERDLEMKKNELTTLTLHLVNKNEFLVDLKEHIGDNIEDTNLVLKIIAEKIDSTSRDDSDWKRFEDQFLQVNPSFSKKLMDASNNTITKTELKICQLLKTGLSSKEVANIMFLSKRTVDTHRHNIHKKLQLKDVHLTSWLVGL